MKYLYTVLIALLTLSGCALGPDTTNSKGEKSEVSIDEVFSEEDRVGASGPVADPLTGEVGFGDLPGIDQKSFNDYQDFQAWLRARQPENPEFYEFQLWREYLEYLRINSL